MAGAMPSDVNLTCPRCQVLRSFVNTSGGGVLYRCNGCEWAFTFGITTPNTTLSASVAAGAVALTVASGGASYTSGMVLLIDTASGAEVVAVNGSSTGTSIPVKTLTGTGQVTGGLIKGHSSGTAFGKLAVTSSYAGIGEAQVPAAAGWGF
jgi:hypothetical protein